MKKNSTSSYLAKFSSVTFLTILMVFISTSACTFDIKKHLFTNTLPLLKYWMDCPFSFPRSSSNRTLLLFLQILWTIWLGLRSSSFECWELWAGTDNSSNCWKFAHVYLKSVSIKTKSYYIGFTCYNVFRISSFWWSSSTNSPHSLHIKQYKSREHFYEIVTT